MLLIGGTSHASSSETPKTPKTYKDSVAYFSGLALTQVLHEMPFNINPDAYLKGLEQAYTKKAAMTMEDVGDFFRSYSSKLQASIPEGENEPTKEAYNNFPSEYMDSLSYSLGIGAGYRCHEELGENLDMKLIAQGITQGLSGESTHSREEIEDFMRERVIKVRMKELAAEKDEIALQNEKEGEKFLAKLSKEDGVMTSPSGLVYKIHNPGEGDKISLGDTLRVHYELKNIAGEVLDSSRERDNPLKYTHKEGAMIKGFNEGVTLLALGGKATLYIPHHLAYGERGMDIIGPKELLIFEIEIMDRKPAQKVEITQNDSNQSAGDCSCCGDN